MYSLGFKHVIQEQSTASRSTATLMKTGQTTSYRTGDDGDLQAGRDTDFFTLVNYAPFNYTTTASLWTSTTDPDTTTSAYRWNLVQKTLTALIKSSGSNMRTLAVRTFTVTGTILT
jgi:hypothetical protein